MTQICGESLLYQIQHLWKACSPVQRSTQHLFPTSTSQTCSYPALMQCEDGVYNKNTSWSTKSFKDIPFLHGWTTSVNDSQVQSPVFFLTPIPFLSEKNDCRGLNTFLTHHSCSLKIDHRFLAKHFDFAAVEDIESSPWKRNEKDGEQIWWIS